MNSECYESPFYQSCNGKIYLSGSDAVGYCIYCLIFEKTRALRQNTGSDDQNHRYKVSLRKRKTEKNDNLSDI